MDKKTLRKVYIARRKVFSSQNISQESLRVLSILEGLPIWDKRCYHIFLPLRKFNELDTYPIVKRLFALGKKVVTTRSDFYNFSMQACLLTINTPLQLNTYGIPEPLEEVQVNPFLIDVVFVPLLAFDNEGYRVGYGKGFYDRFFTICRSKILKIGLSLFGPIRQISDRNTMDIPLDIAVCPDKVYRFKNLV
ncbi:MAG: 5-formyltetrahydrofolate cyclo-ligase [Flavobacteriales bacterium Tduv]